MMGTAARPTARLWCGVTHIEVLVKRIAAGLALGFTVSCGDGGTEPELAASGSMSFSYNGGTLVPAGGFSASGGLPTSQTEQNTRAWAAAFRNTQSTSQEIGVVASSPRANGRIDLAVVAFDRNSPGTSTIDVENCSANTCPAVAFWYNLSESQTATGEVICGVESGTMTLATVTATRVTGSFSGTGTCTSLDNFTTTTTFTITNGVFDTPLLTDGPVAGSVFGR